MAKRVKDKWLGARVDNDMSQRVVDYTERSEMDMADLVRDAVEEYMINHPAPERAEHEPVTQEA
jgi:hypothetical protein